MKVVSIDKVPKTVSNSPLFTGGEVTHQPVIAPGESTLLGISNVSFAPGARNYFHTHTTDQVLVVTAGKGICGTETEERVVTVGDIIFFKAGEKHWHGATADSAFAHLSILGVGSKMTQLEP